MRSEWGTNKGATLYNLLHRDDCPLKLQQASNTSSLTIQAEIRSQQEMSEFGSQEQRPTTMMEIANKHRAESSS